MLQILIEETLDNSAEANLPSMEETSNRILVDKHLPKPVGISGKNCQNTEEVDMTSKVGYEKRNY